MKKAICYPPLILFAGILFFVACKKQDIGNDNKTNQPPVANAGPDQTTTLPASSVTLNGSGSTDPDNNITGYLWTKIAGPSSFAIANANSIQTLVNNLLEGAVLLSLTT
jgi:hypothetical protein